MNTLEDFLQQVKDLNPTTLDGLGQTSVQPMPMPKSVAPINKQTYIAREPIVGSSGVEDYDKYVKQRSLIDNLESQYGAGSFDDLRNELNDVYKPQLNRFKELDKLLKKRDGIIYKDIKKNSKPI